MRRFALGFVDVLILIAFMVMATPSDATLFCDSDQNPGPPVTWNKGQPTDAIHALSFDTGVQCFATGDELRYIQSNFTGIRGRTNAGFINWYDEDALFIVGNL